MFNPVAHLGGDLYDFITFDDGRLAIVAGDVAGKGAPAALYAALSSGIIRTRATRKYPSGQMLELVNKTLFSRPIESQYCALTYAIYDPQTRKITLANSGLPYPICYGMANRDSWNWAECRSVCFRIPSIRNWNWSYSSAMFWFSTPTAWLKHATTAMRISD